MAFDPSMAYAVPNTVASSAEYNKIVDNVTDLNARMTDGTTGNPALGARVSALEGASAVVGSWVSVTSFANSWTNRTGSFYPLRVRLLPGANVQIIGTLGIKSAGAANNEKLFDLPNSTYWPKYEAILQMMDSGARAVGIRITAAGEAFAYLTGSNTANTLHINTQYPSATATP